MVFSFKWAAPGLWIAAVLLCAAFPARAVTLQLADGRGIRSLPPGSPPFLLGFFVVKTGATLDDRSALEFDVSGLAGAVASATLGAYWNNIDPAPPDGVMDVYTYEGDGVITTADYSAGTFFTSVVHNEMGGPNWFLSIDVTGAVQNALANGHTYLGFLLAAGSSDRFEGPDLYGEPDPVLVVNLVPEPGSAWLLAGLGLIPALLRKPTA